MRSKLDELRELDAMRLMAIREALREDTAEAVAYLGIRNERIGQLLKTMSPVELKQVWSTLGPSGLFRMEEGAALEAVALSVQHGRQSAGADSAALVLTK